MYFCEVTDQLIAKRWKVSKLHLTKRKPKKSKDSKKEKKVNLVLKAAKRAI